MIFISHTAKDKPIVEPIAIRLAEVFGQEQVFYDSWSIQPGDGIIDKMNSGLEKCKFFFLFVSNNSLKSKMVTLEWQNALLKASNEKMKVIPVKIDDCLVPPILLQSLYIDVYGQGMEIGIRQMIDVIKQQNIYKPNLQEFENMSGTITYESRDRCIVEFKAEYYLEPISRYCILLKNDPSTVTVTSQSDSMHTCGQRKDFKLNTGEVYNALFEAVDRGTTPTFPYVVEISTKDGSDLEIVGLMHAKSSEIYRGIPTVINKN